jgi:8-oxo-dGTP diphosphatase
MTNTQHPPEAPKSYKQPITTVDIVMLTIHNDELHVVLQPRTEEPFAEKLSLVGGYIHVENDDGSPGDRDTYSAALRVLERKTGIVPPFLEQLYTFSGQDRDPRGWSMSVTYYAVAPSEVWLSNTKNVELRAVDGLEKLGFDHNHIVDFAAKRLRDKANYSTLPCYLLPEEFTMSELQGVYEMLTGRKMTRANFERKLDEQDIASTLELLEGKFKKGRGRSAQLYRVRPDVSLGLFNRSI